ncbi:alanine racemase [Paenibacillus sp. strain BS8-2]
MMEGNKPAGVDEMGKDLQCGIVQKSANRYRDTWAEVNLSAIRHNISSVRNAVRRDCRLMAVVKADGYGHGAIRVAETALESGATDLGVAFLEEALVLIEAGIQAPILILGHTNDRAVELAIRHGIAMTVFSEASMRVIAATCERLGQRARIHLKIDTGMTRLGVNSATQAWQLARIALENGEIDLEGIFTHFADADNEDESYTQLQFERFIHIVDELEQRGIHFLVRHCCNSAATVKYPDKHLDMVRWGIGLYGLLPAAMTARYGFDFHQAMSLKSCVSQLAYAEKGTSVGYGRSYQTDRQTLIATLPIGYADGYSRKLSNNGEVLFQGASAPVVGRICMDQMMVDVSEIEHIQVGDTATLFGRHEGMFLSIEEIASRVGTITYEVVTSIGSRVPRYYIE